MNRFSAGKEPVEIADARESLQFREGRERVSVWRLGDVNGARTGVEVEVEGGSMGLSCVVLRMRVSIWRAGARFKRDERKAGMSRYEGEPK